MKKFFFTFFLSLLVGSSAGAFWSHPDLVRESRVIKLSIQDSTAHIEITEKIHNPTQDEHAFTVYEPLQAQAQNITLSIDFEPVSPQILNQKDALPLLADQAVVHKDYRYYRLYADHYPKLLKTAPLTINPQETKTCTLRFEQKLFSKGKAFTTDLFLNDEIQAEAFQILINLFDSAQHFYTNLPSSTQIQQWTDQTTWLFEAQNYTPTQNLFLMTSPHKDLSLSTTDTHHTYTGTFLSPSGTRSFDRVQILLDRSGSMLGDKWNRVQDWMHYVGEFFGEETRIRIGLFDKELTWYDPDYVANDFNFKKNLFQYLQTVQPVGKTDLSNILSNTPELFTDPQKTDTSPDARLTIIITDEEEWSPAQKLPDNTILLHFGQTNTTPLAQAVKNHNGLSISIFEHSSQLLKKNEWEDRWSNWTRQYTLPKTQPAQHIGNIAHHTAPQSPIILQRSPKKETPFDFPFLKYLWGQRQIAHLIQQKEYTTETLDAILSLGRSFGISTPHFDAHTDRQTLQKTLQGLTPWDKKSLINNLNGVHTKYSNKKRTTTHRPVYKEKETITHTKPSKETVWRTVDFHERNIPETRIQIAPYSPAQTALFLQFPDLVADGFGLAQQIDFCAPFRCLSVRHDARTQSIPQDRAFFRDYDPDHWANEYLKKGVLLGLIEAERNGKLHADRGIDRGDFVQMVYQHIFKSTPHPTPTQTFEDITDKNRYFESTALLANKNIIQGYKDNTFRPLQTLTRAEGIKILLASLGFQPTDTDAAPLFDDAIGWEKPWVNEAFRRGIVSGKTKTHFKPHEPLTRAEALKILLNTSPKPQTK